MLEFDDFFDRERDGLLRLCWLSTLDREAAAEVAQEALTRAWSDWERLSAPGSNPAAWVTTVALNLARSRGRRLRRWPTVLTRLGSEAAGGDGPVLSDPALLAAIRSLSQRQREAIVLRYWADLTVDDCAERMGISPGSVKRHLTRAHERLRTELDPSMLVEVL